MRVLLFRAQVLHGSCHGWTGRFPSFPPYFPAAQQASCQFVRPRLTFGQILTDSPDSAIIPDTSVLKGINLRFASMTAGLTAGVAAAVLLACAGGAYIYSRHHLGSLLETARNSALADGELIRVALEHQMMENDRSLIARMIQSFANRPRVEQVALLDRFGIERFSAGPRKPDQSELRIDSPTCQACHRYPPDQRGSSRVIETRGGTLLRTVATSLHTRSTAYSSWM
jgi:hypothetical protein